MATIYTSTNWYAAYGNNPVNAVDPWGLRAKITVDNSGFGVGTSKDLTLGLHKPEVGRLSFKVTVECDCGADINRATIRQDVFYVVASVETTKNGPEWLYGVMDKDNPQYTAEKKGRSGGIQCLEQGRWCGSGQSHHSCLLDYSPGP